ncbi:MAG: hypothetical protein M0O96_01085 [Desulforhopalus sp.]|nr:hypothetical protein [Desulforhopalus sp.]
MRQIRRSLHRHPELAFEEMQTAALICSELEPPGIPARSGVAGTGIVAVLKKGDGPVVALRAGYGCPADTGVYRTGVCL